MKNFRLLILGLITLIFPLSLSSKQVDVHLASTVAETIIGYSSSGKGRSEIYELTLVYTAKENNKKSGLSGQEVIYYYVFNFSGNGEKGFVIVSGDDACIPVLGYSFDGFYDTRNLPPNFEAWMNGREAEIAYIIETGLSADEEIKMQWEMYGSGIMPVSAGSKAVSQLVATQWDQDDPYNLQCPKCNGYPTLTGCVATAMAQIMKYHGHPARGTGSIPNYQILNPDYCHELVVPSVIFDSYNWDAMTNTYNASSSSLAKEAVARIMFHAGASVQMLYGVDASGAYNEDVPVALTTYFKYDKSIQYLRRGFYSDSEWISILKAEIDATRPVYYSGTGTYGGHAFVCDGYDNSNQFHFNWGWGGSSDGYFSVAALNPSVYNFNDQQTIITGIKPDAAGSYAYSMNLYGSLSATVTSITAGENFSAAAGFVNTGWQTFPASSYYAIALVDANDEILQILKQVSISNLIPPGWYFDPRAFECTVPVGVTSGSYFIRAVTKPAGGNTWSIARAKIEDVGRLPLQVIGATYTITASAGTGGNITPSGNVTVNHGANQTFTITPNTGYQIDKVLVNGSNNSTAVANGSYTFSNVTGNHSIAASFKLKTYTITASAGTGGNITPSGSVTVNHGTNQTFTITPNTGYQIDKVLVNGSNNSTAVANGSYTFSNVTGNHTIAASFKLKTYTITASAGTGGNITPSGNVTVNHGANQTFTITPNTGYQIDKVLVNGSNNSTAVANGSYTFSNVTGNHSIEAIFKMMDAEGEQILFTWNATAGSNKSVTFRATAGKVFVVNWGDGVSGTYTGNGNTNISLSHTYASTGAYPVTIRAFTTDGHVTYLHCGTKQVTTLDVSQNTKLTYLNCEHNLLSTLNVSQNTKLEELYFSGNQLTALNVSMNTELTNLNCSKNQLTTLDVSNNTKLGYLNCESNQLTALNTSGATSLTRLYCYYNQLKFSTLPLPRYTSYEYAKQDTINGGISTGRIDLSSEYSINGKATNFTWYELNGNTETVISSGYTNHGNGTFTFGTAFNNKTLRCKMTNATFPDFTASAPLVYEVTIEAPVQYTITATAGTGGSINPKGEVSVIEGDHQIFTFAANRFFEVDLLLIDGINVPDSIAGGRYTFVNVTEDHTIEVRFKDSPPLFCGGTGTSEDPYLICNLAALANLAAYVNAGNGAQTVGKHYRLMNDLDLAGWAEIPGDTKGWKPIGNYTLSFRSAFQGTFDGNGHVIKNMNINRPDETYIGLFGLVYHGNIKDIGVVACNLIGNTQVGGLVGENSFSPISNSYVTGSISGNGNIGGLVGDNHNNQATISNSYVTGSVSGSGNVGGLVGLNYNQAVINNSYAIGNVSTTGDNTHIGGLVGENRNATIQNCVAANVLVTAAGTTGSINRIAGHNNNGVYNNNYALSSMEVTANNQPVTISPNLNGASGADKELADLQSYSFYSTGGNWYDSIAWSITPPSGTPEGIWKICDGENFPILQWQTDEDGTFCFPYLIYTVDDLANLAAYVNAGNGAQTVGKHYRLMNDLDLAGWAEIPGDTKGWKPIGNYTLSFRSAFQGTFDGNGHVIKNMNINRPDETYIGLFGLVYHGNIKDIGVVACNLIGNTQVGGLVGENSFSPISNSYVTGSISGNGNIGGLVGDNHNNQATISNSYVTGSVSGSGNVGGLVGLNYNQAVINNSYAIGNVSTTGDNTHIGGLVGENRNATIQNCVAANVLVTAAGTTGSINRIAGHNNNGVYNNNYALSSMEVTANNQPVTISPNLNGASGADKELADLQSYSFYSTGGNWYDSIAWSITPPSGTPEGIWKICDGENFPILQWQTDEDGTFCFPYLIYTVDALANLAAYVNAGNGAQTVGKHYRLMNDLDLAGWAEIPGDTKGWKPIGNYTLSFRSAFQGTFDGNGHVIKNMNINRPDETYIGLFGLVYHGNIKDIGVVACNLIGNTQVGGLVGENSFSPISNSYVTGSISGNGNIGGLVGDNHNNQATISNSYVTGSVSGSGNVGGLVGLNYNQAVINNSYAIGNVSTTGDNTHIGGLVGENRNATIQNCVAANVLVTAAGTTGSINRIAGHNNNGVYNNNYALSSMEVTANNQPVTISPNLNGASGADKELADLQSYSFYSTGGNWYDSIAWSITPPSGTPEGIWKICDGEGLPFF